MMDARVRILLVAHSPAAAGKLAPWLGLDHVELTVVSEFARGKVFLELQPDLLIAEVKLGTHNGLHLALHATHAGIPAIVLGDADLVLERDAAALGVRYLRTAEVNRQVLRDVVSELLPAGTHPHPTGIAWVHGHVVRPLPFTGTA